MGTKTHRIRLHTRRYPVGAELLAPSVVDVRDGILLPGLVDTPLTAAFLGGSGVGKSTLVNRIVGTDVQATGAVRERDDKGRHTTVARELVLVPGGGVIVDTPGMRGLGLWDAEDGLEAAFPEIDALAEQCRFRDCGHVDEPGCAVKRAVRDGELPERRLESYLRLRAEMAELVRRQDQKAWAQKEQTNKAIAKAVKNYYKDHPHKR